MTPLCTGDILFCSGTSVISEQIKNFTNSIYSHVGLIFTANIAGRRIPFVVEAVTPAVVVIPLEQILHNYKQSGKPYPGKLYVGRCVDGLNMEQCSNMMTSALKCVGKQYDTASIIKQAFNKIFGADLTDKDHHRLICSELVGCAYAAAGINLKKDRHGYWTPGSIGRDSQIIVVELK